MPKRSDARQRLGWQPGGSQSGRRAQGDENDDTYEGWRQAGVPPTLPTTILHGDIAARALGLVVGWARAHQQELLDDWELGAKRRPLRKIPPL